MISRKVLVSALAVAAAGIASVILAGQFREASRREAFIYRCNEEGAGGMITSRQYCEQLYDRSVGKGAPAQDPR